MNSVWMVSVVCDHEVVETIGIFETRELAHQYCKEYNSALDCGCVYRIESLPFYGKLFGYKKPEIEYLTPAV